MTLAAFFETRIFEPLGMNDTGFFLDDNAVQRLAALYTDADGGIREVTDETMRDGYLVYSATYHHGGPRTYYSGGAGLVSTVSDYARFLQMLLNGGELDGVRLLSPQTVAMMTRNSIGELSVGPGVKFGLGFGVVEDPGLTADPRSDGTYYWGGIFNTRFFVDPPKSLSGSSCRSGFRAMRGASGTASCKPSTSRRGVATIAAAARRRHLLLDYCAPMSSPATPSPDRARRGAASEPLAGGAGDRPEVKGDTRLTA